MESKEDLELLKAQSLSDYLRDKKPGRLTPEEHKLQSSGRGTGKTADALLQAAIDKHPGKTEEELRTAMIEFYKSLPKGKKERFYRRSIERKFNVKIEWRR